MAVASPVSRRVFAWSHEFLCSMNVARAESIDCGDGEGGAIDRHVVRTKSFALEMYAGKSSGRHGGGAGSSERFRGFILSGKKARIGGRMINGVVSRPTNVSGSDECNHVNVPTTRDGCYILVGDRT